MKYSSKLIVILSGILIIALFGIVASSIANSNVINAQKQEFKYNNSKLEELVAERDRINELIKSKDVNAGESTNTTVSDNSDTKKIKDQKEVEMQILELERQSEEIAKKIKELQNNK